MADEAARIADGPILQLGVAVITSLYVPRLPRDVEILPVVSEMFPIFEERSPTVTILPELSTLVDVLVIVGASWLSKDSQWCKKKVKESDTNAVVDGVKLAVYLCVLLKRISSMNPLIGNINDGKSLNPLMV